MVVISIISLLIAIVVPSLGKAKQRAVESVCQSRIRALNLATLNYLAEFDNTFPVNGLLFPKAKVPARYMDKPEFADAEVTVPQYWRPEYGALWTMMGGAEPTMDPPLPAMDAQLAKALLCPNDTLQRKGIEALTMQRDGTTTSVQVGEGSPGYWSYSVNSVLNSLGRVRNDFPKGLPWADPLKGTNIQMPSNFIFFVEEDEGSLFNDEVMDAPAFNKGDKLTDRHSYGGNVGFADGHVEWFSEVAFNNVPSKDEGGAFVSPYTKMFFPDQGEFMAKP
jgi:prepilin-type processing-associated H-X9-DG protein